MIISAFACSLLLMGCSAYQSLRPEEQGKMASGVWDSCDTWMQVEKTDGSVVELKPFRYVIVRDSSEFIYADGVTWNRNAEQIPFHGIVCAEAIMKKDTVSWPDEFSRVTGPNYWFYTEGGSIVRAPERDVLFVKKRGGTGIWRAGWPNPESYDGENADRIIRFDDISSIKSFYFSGWATAASVAGAIAVGVGMAYLISAAERNAFGFGGWK